MKRVLLKRYQIIALSLIQVIFIIASLSQIMKTSIIYAPIFSANTNVYINSIFVGVFILIISMYGYITKKFWELKNFLIYKVFSILNILYLCNLIFNLVSILCLSEEKIVNTFVEINIGICILFIGDLILILIYNKNVQNLKYKAN
ncbi:MAG: hypothetical protein ACRDAU_06950 [Clostridium sp.]